MDELVVCPASTACSSPSPASFFSTAGHHQQQQQELDFVSSEVLEQWLAIDDCMDDETLMDGAAWGIEGSRSPGNDLSGKPPAPAPKRRGRKPGPGTSGLALTHVEAERQRRDKLNRRFYELRAAVPTVSRMDKASLLADAAAYITQLRGRVEQLEAEAKQAAASAVAAAATAAAPAQEKLEVRMVGQEAAALRLTTAARHAPARLMLALRSLDLPVQHACVCRVGSVTVQDAVVDVPAAALRDERRLRAALLNRLQQSG
ncbi:hypothetical protein SETIT_6G234000v2 [Setaria italica]|uniref:Transcription factor n=1 Tax=Setaria italica TaxID=4555 RepID=K3YLA3_SETIT|nr:transcription factor MYC2 [Setaria italica]RCV32141.1 hypothetical protein SETIT_6G234000v2 [Setaria italica]